MTFISYLENVKHQFNMNHFLDRRLKKKFKLKMGYDLNLENPQTFSEKIQWMKLHYRNPLMTTCADKFLVRKYVINKLGTDEILVPLYGVYTSTKEINITSLPAQFVLKPNNGSGDVVICQSKDDFDWGTAYKQLDASLNSNYFYVNGEYQYKNIIPKITCEQFLGNNMTDYKFFCFNGEPLFCNVIGNRDRIAKSIDECFYDCDYNVLEIYQNGKHKEFPKPQNWAAMIEVAKKLSTDFPFVRVDLYNVNGQIYFGELTFTPANGMVPWHPLSWDYKLGGLIHLDRIDPGFIKK